MVKCQKRWDRACRTNREAIIYVTKIQCSTNTKEDDEALISLFSDLFHSTIKSVMKKYKTPNHCDSEDLYQICLITLFNCAKKFDLGNKDAQFLAYLRTAIRYNLVTYLRVITHNWKDIMLNAISLDSFENDED